MVTKKAFALKAFITGIVCVVMVGFGWLSDPLTANDQSGALSRLLAWLCLAAAAVALIVAIYFTVRALTICEPQKEADFEFEGDDSGESPGTDRNVAGAGAADRDPAFSQRIREGLPGIRETTISPLLFKYSLEQSPLLAVFHASGTTQH